jgi:glucose-6-phosphate dehydrogenase assembly protein OpcA
MSAAERMTSRPPAGQIDVNVGGERISVDHISRELNRLWSDISRQVEDQSGQIPLRTSILTLVVVARGKLEVRTARNVLHALAEQLPSRAIVIEIVDEGVQLDASISANCRMLTAGRATCYEIIEIRAPADRLAGLPSLLVPLELYDVPSYMWWVGDLDFRDPSFLRVSQSAERIIIDSSHFDSAPYALADFESFLESGEARCTGTDLNWARTTSWRELIAQSFDHPLTQGLLNRIQRVEIGFDSSAEPQALLIAGWLATRLNWSISDATATQNELTLKLRSRAGDVSVRMTNTASAGVGLRSVRILAGTGSRSARIAVRRRSDDLAAVAVEAAGMPRQERVVRDRQPELHELIGKELLIQTRDPVFDEALDFVSGVVTTLRSQHG